MTPKVILDFWVATLKCLNKAVSVRVITLVIDDKAGIHGDFLVVIPYVQRACVTAHRFRLLKHGDVVLWLKQVGGGKALICRSR